MNEREETKTEEKAPGPCDPGHRPKGRPGQTMSKAPPLKGWLDPKQISKISRVIKANAAGRFLHVIRQGGQRGQKMGLTSKSSPKDKNTEGQKITKIMALKLETRQEN